MRQYMECLVSKAMSTCPQILCSDNGSGGNKQHISDDWRRSH